MNPLWLLRAKRWAQHPPSWGRVKLGLAVILACAALYGVEQVWGWPAWLTPDRGGRAPVVR